MGETIVQRWITVARNELVERLDSIVGEDHLSTSENFSSSSALDICQCFPQIIQFCRRLPWSNITGAVLFLI